MEPYVDEVVILNYCTTMRLHHLLGVHKIVVDSNAEGKFTGMNWSITIAQTVNRISLTVEGIIVKLRLPIPSMGLSFSKV